MNDTSVTTSRPFARRRSRIRAVLLMLVIAFVGGGGFMVWQAPGKETAPKNVRTAIAKVADIVKTVAALGSLEPKNYVDVGAQVSGQLKAVYLNYDIVNAQRADRSHAVFRRLDRNSTIFQSRSAGTFGNIGHTRFDPYRLGKIRAHKNNTRIDISGTQNKFHILAVKQTLARKLYFIFYRFLQIQVLYLSSQALSIL